MVYVLIVFICCWVWEEQITNWSGRGRYSFELLLKVAVDSSPVSVSLSNVKTFVDMQCHGQNRYIVVILIKRILFSLLILVFGMISHSMCFHHLCIKHLALSLLSTEFSSLCRHEKLTKLFTKSPTCLLHNNKCKLFS